MFRKTGSKIIRTIIWEDLKQVNNQM